MHMCCKYTCDVSPLTEASTHAGALSGDSVDPWSSFVVSTAMTKVEPAQDLAVATTCEYFLWVSILLQPLLCWGL